MTQDEARKKRPLTSREKVQAHRARLRAQGLRPIQVWVPDVRSPGFREQAHRDSIAVAQSAQAEEDQAWVDSVSEFNEPDFDTRYPYAPR